jgi:hypothetical protein
MISGMRFEAPRHLFRLSGNGLAQYQRTDGHNDLHEHAPSIQESVECCVSCRSLKLPTNQQTLEATYAPSAAPIAPVLC